MNGQATSEECDGGEKYPSAKPNEEGGKHYVVGDVIVKNSGDGQANDEERQIRENRKRDR